MTVKNWTHWTTLLLISTLTISGCSLIPNKKIDIVSKPLEIDIIQPTMPRNIDLKEPKFYVVSEAKIANPCVKNEEGKRPRTKIDGKWVCDLGKENPDWPENYTYLDRFMDDMKKMNKRVQFAKGRYPKQKRSRTSFCKLWEGIYTPGYT